MRFITPGWAAVLLAAIALLVTAWMARYEQPSVAGGMLWDRWNHVPCYYKVPGMPGDVLTCAQPASNS